MGEQEEAVHQIRAMRELVYDSETKLMYHVWDDVKEEYVNSDFWGIGMGLALMGMVTVSYTHLRGWHRNAGIDRGNFGLLLHQACGNGCLL